MTNISHFDKFEVHRHSSINQIQHVEWDKHIAQGNIFKNVLFMQCVEHAFEHRTFNYFTIYNGALAENKLVGVVFTTQEDWDMQLMLPHLFHNVIKAVRTIFPRFAILKLAMTGCMETAESHWWFDTIISDNVAAELIEHCLSSANSDSHISIVRDLLPSNQHHNTMMSSLSEHHYTLAKNLPLTQIKLAGMSALHHFERLKSKFRKSVKKALKQCREQGITIEHYDNIDDHIETLYPLYLEVHERAKEYKREPMPKTFFKTLDKLMPEQTFVTIMKSKTNKVLGFVLTGMNNTYCVPFVFGRDYGAPNSANVYYSLLWEIMIKAGEQKVSIIDLGVTNYFVKQNLGAEIINMSMACKFNNSFLNKLLSPFIPQIMGAEQPIVRELFKQSTMSQNS